MQNQEERKEKEKITEEIDVREKGGNEEGINNKKEKEEAEAPILALNHISRLCRDVKESIEFYTKVLGFVLMERPETLDFEGAWLFNYGVGIHLVQSNEEHKLPSHSKDLNPQDNHISFQCEDIEGMEKRLKEKNVKYKKRTMETEDGTAMDQIFFNDPDGFMVEICNCENLKLVPANEESQNKIKLPMDRHTPPVQTNHQNDHA